MFDDRVPAAIMLGIIGGLIGFGTGQWLASAPVEATTPIGIGIGGLIGYIFGRW